MLPCWQDVRRNTQASRIISNLIKCLKEVLELGRLLYLDMLIARGDMLRHSDKIHPTTAQSVLIEMIVARLSLVQTLRQTDFVRASIDAVR